MIPVQKENKLKIKGCFYEEAINVRRSQNYRK